MTRVGAAIVTVVAIASLSACKVADVADSGGKDSGAKGSSSGSTKKADKFTTAQDGAIRAAQSYLDLGSGFSRAGLIQQLTSKAGNGFKMADATFAVDHLKVDYNKQAVLSAKSYLDLQGFSRDGLIEQLTSKAGSQYTLAQAKYAADKVGL